MEAKFDRIVRKIAENIEDAFDDMDTDDIQEAIRENIDLSEVVRELYKEDPDVRDKIKAVVKKLIIEEIENTDNVNDLEALLPPDTEWSEVVSGVLDNPIILPGLTEDETRYFQWLLCQNLKQIDEQKWKDLGKLNQKILAAMYREKSNGPK